MKKRKPIPPQQLVRAVADAARGASRRSLQEKHQLPERLCRAITAAGLGQAEFRRLLAEQFRMGAVEMVQSLREDLAAGRISPNCKALAAGILTDKAAMLESLTAMDAIPVNVLVNNYGVPGGKTREEMIRSLTGNAEPNPALPFPKNIGDAHTNSNEPPSVISPGAASPS